MSTARTGPLDEGYRSVDGHVHDLDERRHQVIVSLPHETLDHYMTDFQRGAFADSFRRHLPEMLGEHDPHQHLGHAIRAEVLPTDNRIIGAFDDFATNPTARRYFGAIKDGRVKGWSFFFRNGEHIRHPHVPGALRYTRADMEEFSATARPAIPGTLTLGIRSRGTSTAQGAGGGVLDRIDDLRCRIALLRADGAEARAHEAELAQMRHTGRLPFYLWERAFDATTRACETEAALENELEDLFDRHAYRSALRSRP